MLLKHLWDSFTDHYSLTPIHPQFFLKKYSYTSIKLAKKYAHGVLIDVGCGRATYKNAIIPHVDKYITVDSPRTSRLYKGKVHPDILADINNLPLPAKYSDTVLLLMVLEHLSDPQLALLEINRVLKKNGILILSTLQSYPLHDRPYDFFRFTKYGLLHLLETSGFKVVTHKAEGNMFIESFQNFNIYCLMAAKKGLSKQVTFLPSVILLPPILIVSIVLNFLAFPFLLVDRNSDFTMIHTIVAKKIH